jgi:CheY-like chemotaxis protein
MPVLDGWGVLEELRDRPDAPPVIVVSAAASTANTERAYRLGARGYVTKPFSLEGLIEAIRDALKPSPQPLNK